MSKIVKVKNVCIGGGNPVSVQSMTNLPVTDIDGTLEQIKALKLAGCDIVRIAVPNVESADAFKIVKNSCDMPLVADIHFNSETALLSIEGGADKVRLNPGNFPEKDLLKVIDCAKMHKIPIRIGVNGGSVNKEMLARCNGDKVTALYQSLYNYVQFFEKNNFDDIVLSLKSSNVLETIKINEMVSKLGYPIHLGVTEAGLYSQGLIKNSIGIGALLLKGIGDTIRVSLTADPVLEVQAGIDILTSLGMRSGLQFVSCPKCGRSKIDLEKVASEVYSQIKGLHKSVKVAVMGCEVNGPGECADADLGLAGGDGKFLIFKHGKPFKTVDEKDAVSEFVLEVQKFTNDN